MGLCHHSWEVEWVNWFTSVGHMFVDLCNWNFRYISQFLQVGYGPITVKMLPYPEVWGWDVNCINICSIQRYIHHHSVILIMWGRRKFLDVAPQAGDNPSMWKGCWSDTVLMALSGQIIVVVDPSVLEFEGMIHRFEVNATGMNVCGSWDIDREHCSPVTCLFLAYR